MKKHHILFYLLAFFRPLPNDAGPSLPASPLPAVLETRIELEEAEEDIPSSPGASVINGSIQDDWRQALPAGLRNLKGAPLHRISINEGVVLYLLGSSHVSRTSCDDVKLLMEHVRPDALFVELCSQRAGMMMEPPPTESNQQRTHNNEQSGKASMVQRGNLLYSKIQMDYAKKLNVTIGGEFREAFQSALSQQRQFWKSQQKSFWGMNNPYLVNYSPSDSELHPRGSRPCAIILGDRPVRITLLRAWESLQFFGKFKLIVGLLWSSIRQPSEKELREWMESILNDRSGKNDLITKSMEELGKAFPSLKRTIIEERDEYMVAKLRQTADLLMYERSESADEKIIVAVVGAGHCSGMLNKLMQDFSDNTTPYPEEILPDLIETKNLKVSNDAEVESLVSDVVQFDYSCLDHSEIQ